MTIFNFKKETNTKKAEVKSATIEAGNPLRDKKPMSLFTERPKIPLITLNPEQFDWPKTFIVRNAQRVDEKVIDYETGWNKTGTNGKCFTTGKHNIQLTLSDGDFAQALTIIDRGVEILPTVTCLIEKDIPLDKFKDDVSTVKLVRPVVILGDTPIPGMAWNHGVKWDHLKIICEDVEFV